MLDLSQLITEASTARDDVIRAARSLPEWTDDAANPMATAYVGALLPDVECLLGRQLTRAFERYVIATARLQTAVREDLASR